MYTIYICLKQYLSQSQKTTLDTFTIMPIATELGGHICTNVASWFQQKADRFESELDNLESRRT